MLLAFGLGVQILIKKYEASFAGRDYVQYVNIAFSLVVTLVNALLG